MQNKIKSKRVLKWIEKQVEQLKPESYIAFPKTFGVPPHEQFERKKVEPYWYDEPVEYPKNHKRRAYRLYKKFGLEGVNFYFLKYGLTLNSVNPILED